MAPHHAFVCKEIRLQADRFPHVVPSTLPRRAQSCSAARPASLAGQTSARKAKALKLQRPLLSEVLMVIATAARQDAAESDPPVALSEPRATR